MSSRRWWYSTSFSFLLPELSKVGSMCIKTGGEGKKGWLQSWGGMQTYTWWFGCAHRPVGGSSSGGVPEAYGWSFCQHPRADSRLRIPSVLFAFLPSRPPPTRSHCGLFSERAAGPSSCSVLGQVDPYMPPPLRCHNVCTSPLPPLPLLPLLLLT